MIATALRLVSLAIIPVAIAGCGEGFANLFASLGGSTVGQRGTVHVTFINNTDYRPVFTLGTFDQTDPAFVPDAAQFDIENADVAPQESTDIGELQCARVFGIGSPRLLDLIESNVENVSSEDALIEGVAFYEADVTDPTAADPVGTAPAFEALLGVDYPCGALLILYFEPGDTTGQFRIDFEIIPAESTR